MIHDADRKGDTKDAHLAVGEGYVPLIMAGKNAIKDKDSADVL